MLLDIWSRKVIGIEPIQKLDNSVFHDMLGNVVDYSNIIWSKDFFEIALILVCH